MVNQKGISTIIATLVLLLVTLGIISTAAMWLMGYFGGITKYAIEVTATDCSPSGAKIYVKNIGTETITNAVLKVMERKNMSTTLTKVCNDTLTAGDIISYLDLDTPIELNQIGTITDVYCNSTAAAGVVIKYKLYVTGGRPQTVQVNC